MTGGKKKSAPHASANEDPIVRSVRAVRAKILRDAGGMVDGYFEAMQELTKQRKAARKPRKGRAA
jgi:hypothetical protein